MIKQIPDFSDVQSGSSSAYAITDPYSFVERYPDTPILGDNEWWFNHDLYDYIIDKGVGWPPYGVIVAPEGRDMLVWFDASSKLHVVDLIKAPNGVNVAYAVKQPEYFEDPQYLELWKKIIKPLVPTVPDITKMLMVVLGIGVVVILIQTPSLLRGK